MTRTTTRSLATMVVAGVLVAGSWAPAAAHAHRHGHPWPGHPGRRVIVHRIHPGDTATGLAVRFHAWTAELLAINHLHRRSTLYVGERIRIPVVVAAARRARHHARHHPGHGTHHRAHHRARHRAHHRGHRHHAHHHRAHYGHHPRAHHTGAHHRAHHHRHDWRGAHASRAEVRRIITLIAHSHHVGPNLALAVAWEESGWQQHVISPAHAIGVMQVLPSTGRWISTYAGHRLQLYHLHDNATAGVLFLRLLREEARDRKHAVAGYYQGLASVRQDGMYHSTKHYVRTVLNLRRHLRHGWHPE